jgi:uncharacterized protein (TIGR03118 family)
VWNPNGQQFLVAPQLAALFIFATEDGTISAWNPTVDLHNAVLKVDNSQGGNGAVYKGLALSTNSTGIFLFATNFRDGTVDVFDSSFKPAKLSGSFRDRRIPPGYAPFGIALINGNLFVTYALQDAAKHDDQRTGKRICGRIRHRRPLGQPLCVAWGTQFSLGDRAGAFEFRRLQLAHSDRQLRRRPDQCL